MSLSMTVMQEVEGKILFETAVQSSVQHTIKQVC